MVFVNNLYSILFPKQALTVGVLAELRASEGGLAARAPYVHEKSCRNLGNINICEKKVAVARERWSVDQRRCSHSNFIFVNPYKTNEILIFFWSKSRFAYKTCVKSMKNQYFGSQNDPTTKYTTLGPKL